MRHFLEKETVVQRLATVTNPITVPLRDSPHADKPGGGLDKPGGLDVRDVKGHVSSL